MKKLNEEAENNKKLLEELEKPVEKKEEEKKEELNSEKIKQELEKALPQRESIPNPKYDPSKPYVERAQRKEWVPVSMLGKVYVRDNGKCKVGQKCTSDSTGRAVPGNKWRVIGRSAPDIIRILYQ